MAAVKTKFGLVFIPPAVGGSLEEMWWLIGSAPGF